MGNYNFKQEAGFLEELEPTEFTILAILVGLLACTNLSTNEKNSVGNFFFLVGQTMITLAAQENLINIASHNTAHDDLERKVLELEKEINLLKKEQSKYNRRGDENEK